MRLRPIQTSGIMLSIMAVAFPSHFLSAASFESSQPLPSAAPWCSRVRVGMDVGPTGAQFGNLDTNALDYCSRFDGVEIVRRCVAAHCQYVAVWGRDGDYAYYDSKLLLKAPGLGTRDPLRDAVAAARAAHLPIIAYSIVQQPGHFMTSHPELQMRDIEGKLYHKFCYNSAYPEVMKQILAELLAYGLDGVEVDMIDMGITGSGCWCERCQALFEKEYGFPMPRRETWDPAWEKFLEFRYHTSERFEKELTAFVKSVNPKATIDFNFQSMPPYSWKPGQRPVEHAGHGDFTATECGLWGFGSLDTSLVPEFLRAATPGRPYQVAIQRGVRMYHDQTTRPLNDLRWELLTILAHGAFISMVDKTTFEGELDPVTYQRCGAAFQEALAKGEHFGQKPLMETGIYFSSRTRDWLGRDKPERYFQAIMGLHKALVYEHIPFGVVLDENVTLKTLRQFRVLCLPNTGILSEREIRLFRQYVSEGGNLLITGASGCFNAYGEPVVPGGGAGRPSPPAQGNEGFALGELVGARLVRRLGTMDNWLRLPAGPQNPLATMRGEIPADWPFLVMGPAVVLEPDTAEAVGDLLAPHPPGPLPTDNDLDYPMSPQTRVGPALLLNRIGKGKVLTLAGSPDFATADEHGISEARRLLANAVRFLAPQSEVEVSAPVNVESVITDDPQARVLRVHLLYYNAPAQTTPAKNRPYVLPALIEDKPIFEATVRVRRPFKSATTVNRDSKLHRKGNTLHINVRDLHEILVLRY